MFQMRKRATLFASAALMLGAAADYSLDGGFLVSKARAVIGRPLTPLSYAGVARRTTRRVIRRTSVYAATLPAGCTTVLVDGTSLYRCGPTYYQAAGGRYVVVRVD
jgi:hypothetical protein